jgi:hypothetical protein
LQNCQVVAFLQCLSAARTCARSAKPSLDNGFA